MATWVTPHLDTFGEVDDMPDAPSGASWGLLAELLDRHRPAWMAEAACATADVAVFFPQRGEPTAPAKALCETCPALEECDAYAEAEGMRFGIWGGRSVATRSRRRAA